MNDLTRITNAGIPAIGGSLLGPESPARVSTVYGVLYSREFFGSAEAQILAVEVRGKKIVILSSTSLRLDAGNFDAELLRSTLKNLALKGAGKLAVVGLDLEHPRTVLEVLIGAVVPMVFPVFVCVKDVDIQRRVNKETINACDSTMLWPVAAVRIAAKVRIHREPTRRIISGTQLTLDGLGSDGRVPKDAEVTA